MPRKQNFKRRPNKAGTVVKYQASAESPTVPK